VEQQKSELGQFGPESFFFTKKTLQPTQNGYLVINYEIFIFHKVKGQVELEVPTLSIPGKSCLGS